MADARAILISTADENRLWSALSLAAAHAALGFEVSIFFSGAAACAAHGIYAGAGSAAHEARGIASVPELFVSSIQLGVAFSVCQTGMAMCDMTAEDVKPEIQITGLLSWLALHRDASFIFV
jgi:predicted peroxiredoxin